MIIRHYGYNAFLIEEDNKKIAIDPGKSLGFIGRSLIPKHEWFDVTHMFITHNDPDHFDFAVPMAKKSNAAVICGEELNELFASANLSRINSIKFGQQLNVNDVEIEGLKVEHGTLYF